MTTPAPALTPAILDRFGQASSHAGSPLLDVLEPGLSDGQIEGLVAELGLGAPPELRALWGWATMPERPSNPRAWQIHWSFELLPPTRAVHETKARRADPLVHPRHQHAWLAVAVEQIPRYLLLDCSDPAAVLPVLFDEEEVLTAAPSFGALFSYWTELIEIGDCFYKDGRWQHTEYSEPAILD